VSKEPVVFNKKCTGMVKALFQNHKCPKATLCRPRQYLFFFFFIIIIIIIIIIFSNTVGCNLTEVSNGIRAVRVAILAAFRVLFFAAC
jgi:hypothetical protein